MCSPIYLAARASMGLIISIYASRHTLHYSSHTLHTFSSVAIYGIILIDLFLFYLPLQSLVLKLPASAQLADALLTIPDCAQFFL